MPVHLALLNEAQQPWEGPDNLRRQVEILKQLPDDFIPTDNPQAAAAIVFLESNNLKNWRNIPSFLNHELVRAHPEKCFTLNYRAEPVDFFPGVYTSLPRAQHREDWSRPGAYYNGNPNPWAGEYENRPWQPKYLFSFRGAMSHPTRRQMLALASCWPGNPLSWIDRWFNHSESEQREFLQEIVDSQFALCPRGIAVSSHRLYEAMRLGRVPVIISDDWLPPAGPDWPSFTITIPENALESIPERLQARANDATDMGQRAYAAWSRWFGPQVLLRHQLLEIRGLIETRQQLPPPDFVKQWRSRPFYRRHRWLLSQRVLGRIRRLARP